MQLYIGGNSNDGNRYIGRRTCEARSPYQGLSLQTGEPLPYAAEDGRTDEHLGAPLERRDKEGNLKVHKSPSTGIWGSLW